MAAETNAPHVVVEIPVDDVEHQQHQKQILSEMKTISAIQNHPLMEISKSPGHLLLLKLLQRQEDLFGHKMALNETRLDNIKSQIFQLCCFFFAFYGFFLTLLFTAWVNSPDHSCHNWYWKLWRQLHKERNDNRALTRCIQELRMKGASFDLNKEPQINAKRMKSSSVQINWRPIACCSQNLVTISLVCFTDWSMYKEIDSLDKVSYLLIPSMELRLVAVIIYDFSTVLKEWSSPLLKETNFNGNDTFTAKHF